MGRKLTKVKPHQVAYEFPHASDLPDAPLHPKQAKVISRALLVYRNSKQGKWTRISASRNRQVLYNQVHRMKNEQQYAWARFGELESELRFLPFKRTSSGARGMWALFVRFVLDPSEVKVVEEREAMRQVMAAGMDPGDDSSTPEEWERWQAVVDAREKAKAYPYI